MFQSCPMRWSVCPIAKPDFPASPSLLVFARARGKSSVLQCFGFFVQLIPRPRQSKNQLTKNPNIELGIFYRLWLWLRKHSKENVFPPDWNENEAEGEGGTDGREGPLFLVPGRRRRSKVWGRESDTTRRRMDTDCTALYFCASSVLSRSNPKYVSRCGLSRGLHIYWVY